MSGHFFCFGHLNIFEFRICFEFRDSTFGFKFLQVSRSGFKVQGSGFKGSASGPQAGSDNLERGTLNR
jgi:hypothetical protein